ncbi:WD-repeat protein [Calothrix sp. PCC 7716]|nr:WD-repeat protein [Calothrix sp. PCC 7716]
MTKSLVLKLDGDLHEGVRVTLSIGFEGISPYKEVTGNLPPFAPLQTIIEEWRTHYHSLGSNNRALTAKKVTYSGSIAQKQESCKHLAIELQRRLNTWLFSKSFRPIRETWLKELHESDAVRVLIRTSNQQLRQIPWHLWDLLEEYPNVELALSATDYQKRTETKTASIRDKVKILAILGNSTDIDVAADQKLLNSLPDASVTFLVMPQRHEINDSLWEKPWDILFFAGHSQTVGDSGRIYINENKESLTIDDLKYGLKKSISNGLTVAIFNSCDGLGLASSLEALHIPQIIVMREQVPDEVAQVFLKHFLVAFALWGKPLYQAAKEARLKLHGLENKYPCASWLPVICQNGDATPLNWLDLGRRPTDIIPYRGLFAFQEKDAQFFFGRETFTDMLVDAVQKQPLVAVIGSSGSGKSSVVFAGLVRRLRSAGNWHIVDFRPGSRPLFNLASSLVSCEESLFGKLLSRTERLREIRNLASDLQHCIHSLRDRIDDFLKSDPDQHFLLIADQFEELYTMSTDAKEPQAFLDRLLEATHNCHNFAFVITLRADFLGQALSYRPFADALQYADLKLAPMRNSELFAAIEKPAQLLGVTIETGLAERIIRAVSAEPGDLPLLEFALTQLWTKQHKGQLTHTDYDEIGGVEAALARYADSAYDKLNFEEKERAQRIFIQLVHPGEGTEDTRRVATRAEVGEENWDLVTRLASSRLVVTARDEKTGLDTVEVVHEALIRSWGQLQQWMQQDRDFRCWQELLRVAMRTWDSCGFDEATLLRGKPLADAEYWQSQRFLELSLAEKGFIGLSVELRDRELKKHKRRRQLTISVLVSGLVLALILALIAIKQWQKARISEINTFSKSAETLLISNNELDALIPSIKAGRQLKSTFGADANTRMQVVEILWRTLNFVRERNRLQAHDDETTSINFCPHGKLIVSGSADKTIKLWSREGKLLQTFKGHENRITSVSLSQDGTRIASASDDKTIKLWSRDGKLLQTFKGHENKITSVSLSQDGTRIASVGDDKTIKLWSRNGKLLQTLKGHNEEVTNVAFSPDGKMIASTGADKIVKLWSRDGKELRTLNGHKDEVWGVRFSPDGQILATSDKDKTIKLWSRDGKELGTLKGHSDAVWSVVFSPDGQTLASASRDKSVILWNWKDSLDSDLNRLLGRACDWTRDYLKNNPNVSESDKYLCDGIVPQENK